ncbi:MAG: GHKL domain-containing protein [Verrucomicrobiaceae bacterium]|nr:MAG: GHKL domain-containing protein [Verrucomicrobiaceae bacterium]
MARLNLADLVRQTCDLVIRDLRDLNIRLTAELEEVEPTVMANFVDLQQVLINLINNARDAMVSSPDSKEIVIHMQIVDDIAEVSVADVGTGIDDADLERLFQPFFTTKEKGVGLGLQICLSTVQRFGGDMKASNRPGGGAVFSFTLPVVDSREMVMRALQ